MRPDNADLRLTEIAMKKGLVSDERWNRFGTMRKRLERLSERLGSLNYSSAQWNKKISGLNSPGKSGTAYSGRRLLLKHPELRIEKLAEAWPDLFAEFGGDRNLEERVRNAERYAPVEGQMREQLETIRRGMDAKLPEELDYLSMQQLKPELRERLHERRPTNLGAAAKIPGINDTALLYLLHYAKRKVERKPVMTESIALY